MCPNGSRPFRHLLRTEPTVAVTSDTHAPTGGGGGTYADTCRKTSRFRPKSGTYADTCRKTSRSECVGQVVRGARWVGSYAVPSDRVSAFVGFGDGDGDVTGVDLVRVVVAGDRQGSVRGQQDVLAHIRLVPRIVLEELGQGGGVDRLAQRRLFVREVKGQPGSSAEDLPDRGGSGDLGHVDRGVEKHCGRTVFVVLEVGRGHGQHRRRRQLFGQAADHPSEA